MTEDYKEQNKQFTDFGGAISMATLDRSAQMASAMTGSSPGATTRAPPPVSS